MLNTAIENILKPLIDAGYDAYIVGGCVRSIILNEEPHDIDISTNAPQKKIKEIFPIFKDISKNMPIEVSCVVVNNFSFEIARFRKNEVYDDHRTPTSVEFSDNFNDDLDRRDFTINTNAIDTQGNIIAYGSSLSDIDNKIIKCVGDPYKRFNEDVLRILRGVRFAAKYNFSIDFNTSLAMKANSVFLNTLPKERIVGELLKIMESGSEVLARALYIMRDLNILKYVVPPLAALQNFEHSAKHHPEGLCKNTACEHFNQYRYDPTYDCVLCVNHKNSVLNHVIEAVKVSNTANVYVLFAIMMHDVGKAVTHSIRLKNDGWMHSYKGHDAKGVAIIEKYCNDFKLPTKMKEIAMFCAQKHMNMHRIHEMRAVKVFRLTTHTYFNYLVEVATADAKSKGVGYLYNSEITLKDFINAFKIEYTEAYKVTGKFVLDNFNIKQGPAVGEKIKQLQNKLCSNKNLMLSDLIK